MDKSHYKTLYPEVEPYDTGRLRVSALHELHYEQAGNPDGRPVIFLHGGPGGGIVPVYRQVFDPDLYRIVLLDQRGCGQSTPKNELRENTTWDIVADLEALRKSLDIEAWQVFGGSWGSTLGLAYAQAHPARVLEMVLRGITPWRQVDMDWEFHTAKAIWPDVFERFEAFAPAAERDDLLNAYWSLLNDEDDDVRRQAGRLWGEWEGVKCSLVPDWDTGSEWARQYEDGLALIECHYCRNNAFLQSDTQILDDMPKIAHIPAVLVMGRYDICTPMDGAWEIKKRWPAADMRIVPDEGHLFLEPGILHEMISATDRFAGKT